MKGVLILLVTAIVVCVGNRTQGVHRHRHGKTGHKPERDTGSITLKPGTAKNKLFPEYGTNFRYICRATTRPPRPSSTAECLRLIARLRGEQASAASWEPRPPFEATEMD